MYLYELNGFFYIKDCDIYPNWLTYADKTYFMLNNTTREKFIQDVLPLIKNGTCGYDQKALDKIKNFNQAPKTTWTTPIPKIVEPDPINKPLKEHQIEAVKRMLTYPRYGFFLGTGSGKTLIGISLLMTLKTDSALIVTPQKVIGQYQEELNKYIPGNKYIVTNYEQLNKIPTQKFEVIILDESHKVKNVSSGLNEQVKRLTEAADRVYLFTGTPQDKSKHEIFAQLYLLYTHFMPGKTRFINRYFNLDDYYKPKSEKPEFKEELEEMLHSISWGKKTEEVITNLPPEVDHIIECKHPQDLYDELKNDRLLEFPNGSVVVADDKAKLRLKLREICSGHVRVLDPKTKRTGTKPLPQNKLPDIAKVLPTLQQGIIYADFTFDLTILKQLCDSMNYTNGVINGKTKKKESDELIKRFKNGSIKFLIIQCKSGGAGLDLYCTNNVLFYTLPESYLTYTQCLGRIRRQGQTKECNYYYFLCKDSIEEDMLFKSLKRKKNFTNKVFKIYK